MALTETDVIAAAARILDSYGLADLTMRRVADELGVKAGALYYHVPNKQTLLAKVADGILACLGQPADAAVEEWARQWASGFRRVLLGRRDAAEVVASALATGLLAVDPAAPLATRLRAAGMSGSRAEASAQAVCHFVLGHAFQEQSSAQLAALGVVPAHDAAPGEAAFNAGAELLAVGLRAATTRE